MIRHHFTIDVEEYFQVSALEPHVSRDAWVRLPSRIEGSVDRLLELLDAADATGTFFVLGWIGERHPALIRRIATAGHEIASHGQAHRRVTELTPPELRESVRRSRDVLQQLAGHPVVGYRAPSFSITPGLEWALEILVEEGYRYDSSLFPVRRRGYGYPGGRRDPHRIECAAGPLIEFPPTTLQLAGAVLPAAGGAYFRLLPYRLVTSGLRQAERAGHAGTFYIHPWEIDPDQPRLPVAPATRLRHYGGLRKTEPRLRTLLQEFRFQSISASLEPDTRAEPMARVHDCDPECTGS